MSRDEAVAGATSPKLGLAQYENVSRTDAKLVRLGDLRKAIEGPAASGLDDDDPAWVVAVSGDITVDASGVSPQASNGVQNDRWAVTVYDARTHEVSLFDAGKESWPPFFDSLAVVAG